MSGHSKWANIKHRKEAQDKKKTKVFNRLMRDLMSAARLNPDPKSPRLATVIEKARAVNMPKDNIERALKRARGLGEEGLLETVVYELVGPGSSGFIVSAATDNKNRTVADLRLLANQTGATLANANSVRWQFQEKGIIEIEFDGPLTERQELTLIEAGAADIVRPTQDESRGLVLTAPPDLVKVAQALENKNFNVIEAYLGWWVNELRPLAEPELTKAKELFEALSDYPDTLRVSTTFEITV